MATTDDQTADGQLPPIPALRDWIRRWGRLHLRDENVTSLGIGHKEVGGERTGTVCIQFTVAGLQHEIGAAQNGSDEIDGDTVEVLQAFLNLY